MSHALRYCPFGVWLIRIACLLFAGGGGQRVRSNRKTQGLKWCPLEPVVAVCLPVMWWGCFAVAPFGRLNALPARGPWRLLLRSPFGLYAVRWSIYCNRLENVLWWRGRYAARIRAGNS